MNHTFAIIGAAGYVAQKHLEAIKEIGGQVIAVTDPNDNLEVLDQYFPDCEYFKNTADFEAFIKQNPVDFITICSPTHLHFEHIEISLGLGINAICESPLVLSEKQLNALIDLEEQTNKKIYSVLQYRYQPQIMKLKEHFNPNEKHTIELINHTYRGKWFAQSWKGDAQKSGGILTSLGYHFFDFLSWIYGKPLSLQLSEQTESSAMGKLELEHATVSFSLNNADRNNKNIKKRRIAINGITYPIDANTGLFTHCYSNIINNKGIGTSEIKNIYKALEKK
ncbi:MAG TPA: Gfo/Idh/MocA family oxidoreductase [Prolixibacteraceae bacterium]|nr:Gfo/Idh/MocA family oxidoreductase [Prolixibacteraceae bacterium]